MTLLIGIYYLLFFALSWRKAEWAVYWIILTLPSYLIRFSIGPIPFTLLEGQILVLFTVWLIKRNRNSEFKTQNLKKLLVTDYWLPVTIFLLAATISLFTSPDLRAAAGIWKAYFIEPFLFFVVFLTTITTHKKVIRTFWFLGFSIIIPGIFAIYQKFTGFAIPNELWLAPETRRVTSFYGYPNAIGLYFAPIVAGGIAILTHKLHQVIKKTLPERERPIIWYKITATTGIVLIGLGSIVFTRSKGALLAVAASMLFYTLFWKGKRIFFASILLTCGLLVLNPFSHISLSNPTTVAGGSSTETRIDLWRESFAMLQSRPIFGAGLAGFQKHIIPFHEKTHIEIFLYPHQLLINFWSETGLLGLISFLWLIVIFFIYSSPWKGEVRMGSNNSHIPIAITGAMVALLAHGLVDVPYFKNDLSILFWILFGLMILLNKSFDKINTTS